MFTSDNGVLVLVCLLKTMFEVYIKNQIFNRLSMVSSVRKMSQRIIQRLSQTNAKTNCLNP